MAITDGLMAAAGNGFMFTLSVVEEQPLASVNVKATLPAEIPVTTPDGETEALEGWLLTHVPPETGESVVVCPTQIESAPVMLTVGNG